MARGKRLALIAFVCAFVASVPPVAEACHADVRGCTQGNLLLNQSKLTVRGSVVRPNSRAARDVKIVLYSADPATDGQEVASLVSDRRGRFAVSVPAGRRYLVVGTTATERGTVGPFELTPATAPVLVVLRPSK